jgi:hypothetical protein
LEAVALAGLVLQVPVLPQRLPEQTLIFEPMQEQGLPDGAVALVALVAQEDGEAQEQMANKAAVDQGEFVTQSEEELLPHNRFHPVQ